MILRRDLSEIRSSLSELFMDLAPRGMRSLIENIKLPHLKLYFTIFYNIIIKLPSKFLVFITKNSMRYLLLFNLIFIYVIIAALYISL